MGLINRISSLIQQKTNTMLDRFEDPKEALDYSYQKQTEMLIKLRRSIAEVVTSRKRLEIQKDKLTDNASKLEDDARKALDANREDLARLALERKTTNNQQTLDLEKQIDSLRQEESRLSEMEKRLSTKVEEFRSKKEVIKARYTAAQASVKVKESVTGISEEMSDVGMAMSRAEDKTEQMNAKAAALDDMIDSGSLTDYTSDKDDIDKELEKISHKSAVDQELEKLKAERNSKGGEEKKVESNQSTSSGGSKA